MSTVRHLPITICVANKKCLCSRYTRYWSIPGGKTEHGHVMTTAPSGLTTELDGLLCVSSQAFLPMLGKTNKIYSSSRVDSDVPTIHPINVCSFWKKKTYFSVFVVIENAVDKFSDMIRRALVVFIDINPIKSCAQFNDLHSTQHTQVDITFWLYLILFQFGNM